MNNEWLFVISMKWLLGWDSINNLFPFSVWFNLSNESINSHDPYRIPINDLIYTYNLYFHVYAMWVVIRVGNESFKCELFSRSRWGSTKIICPKYFGCKFFFHTALTPIFFWIMILMPQNCVWTSAISKISNSRFCPIFVFNLTLAL